MSLIAEISQNIGTLNNLLRHEQTPGQVLGIDQPFSLTDAQLENVYKRHALPDHLALPDGTFYVGMDDVVSRALLAEIPLGGVVGVIRTHPVSIGRLNPNMLFAREGLGIILENNPSLTRILTFYNTTPWNLESDETGFNEKEITMAAIARMLDAERGIEGSQMNTVFDITQTGLPQDMPVSSYGCLSHNNPMVALAQNIMKGKALMQEVVVPEVSPGMFIRMGLDAQALTGSGLTVPNVDEGVLMFHAYVHTAEKVAATNPRGMGAGTDPNLVFEKTVEAAIALPDKAINGVPIIAVQQEFITSLK